MTESEKNLDSLLLDLSRTKNDKLALVVEISKYTPLFAGSKFRLLYKCWNWNPIKQHWEKNVHYLSLEKALNDFAWFTVNEPFRDLKIQRI